jgi:hypothetical protein
MVTGWPVQLSYSSPGSVPGPRQVWYVSKIVGRWHVWPLTADSRPTDRKRPTRTQPAGSLCAPGKRPRTNARAAARRATTGQHLSPSRTNHRGTMSPFLVQGFRIRGWRRPAPRAPGQSAERKCASKDSNRPTRAQPAVSLRRHNKNHAGSNGVERVTATSVRRGYGGIRLDSGRKTPAQSLYDA